VGSDVKVGNGVVEGGPVSVGAEARPVSVGVEVSVGVGVGPVAVGRGGVNVGQLVGDGTGVQVPATD